MASVFIRDKRDRHYTRTRPDGLASAVSLDFRSCGVAMNSIRLQ
jgi:hypothetical protein